MDNENPIVISALRHLIDAGVGPVSLISSSYYPQMFGDGDAVFRVGSGPLLLRYLTDKGEEFIDIGTERFPDRFIQFGDLEVAMGWPSSERFESLERPEPISEVLARFQQRRQEIERALSGSQEMETRARVDDVARQRGLAWYRKLRGK